MEAGVLELVAILMSMQGFGVDANPKAATPAQITKYEVQDADYVAYIDFEAFVPRNFKALIDLPNQKVIKDNPRLAGALAKPIKEIKAGRMMAKSLAGFDPVDDLKSGAMWIKFPASGAPTGLLVIRGNFPLNLLDTLGRMGSAKGAAIGPRINNNPTIMLAGGHVMAGFIKSDSVVLLGTPDLVKARLAANWSKKRSKPTTASLEVRRMLRGKPFFAVASMPSATAKGWIKSQLPPGPDKLLGDVVGGHSFASLALYHDGIGWSWTDSGGIDGYNRAVMASEGLLDLFRSLQLGSRAVAKLALSMVDSYASSNPVIAKIANNKKRILALLNQITGSGKFNVKWTKSPRTKTVAVRARGKRLGDVVPLAGAIPLIAGTAVLFGSKRHAEKAPVGNAAAAKAVDVAAPPPRGLRVRDTYRRVKREKLQRRAN